MNKTKEEKRLEKLLTDLIEDIQTSIDKMKGNKLTKQSIQETLNFYLGEINEW